MIHLDLLKMIWLYLASFPSVTGTSFFCGESIGNCCFGTILSKSEKFGDCVVQNGGKLWEPYIWLIVMVGYKPTTMGI